MSFEPIRSTRGQPRMRCGCEDCDRTEVVCADHARNERSGNSQAAAKVQKQGWSYIHKHLRCPTCEAKRKVVKMPVKSAETVAPLREMTKKQRFEIIGLLVSVYDLDAKRYTGGDTDSTVAEVLGVMPGWVATVREEEGFGPDGGNEDIEALVSDLDEWRAAAQKTLKASTELNDRLGPALGCNLRGQHHQSELWHRVGHSGRPPAYQRHGQGADPGDCHC